MKQKISVTVEKDVLDKSMQKIQDKTFRNTSHMVEVALFELLKEEE